MRAWSFALWRVVAGERALSGVGRDRPRFVVGIREVRQDGHGARGEVYAKGATVSALDALTAAGRAELGLRSTARTERRHDGAYRPA
jgi:hypothetical protein